MKDEATKLSVVVITLNEEKNLPRLIASLPDGVEFIVVDSCSTDRTKEIVTKAGGVFSTRTFDDFASQKNAAIDAASRPWILSLDADECPTQELWAEVLSFIKTSDHRCFMKINRRQVFLGRHLKFGKSQDAPIRLFAKGEGRFSNEIHETLVGSEDGQIFKSHDHLLHYSYASLTDYFDRFNRYTSAVAVRHFKLAHRIPQKWTLFPRFFWEFLQRYVLRGGFLDGYEGFLFCLYGSTYTVTKYAKLIELKSSR